MNAAAAKASMSESGTACWRCGAELGPEAGAAYVFQCGACDALQPPPADLTHFQLLDLAPRYELDLDALELQYHKLSRRMHPDRFAASDERGRRLSLDWSTRLNDAYATLRDPVRRAEYLLSLQGVQALGETHSVVDPAFLGEQMEFRERLEEARSERDPLAALAALRRDIKAAMEERADALRSALGGRAPQNPHSAALIVQELKFFNKLLQEADRIEEQFD